MKRMADQQDRELVEELLEGIVETLPGYARRPVATYRLQLNPQFGFSQATALVPYLHRLGVTDLYVSPCLKAARGSQHGYDVVDHNELNPELGSPEEFDRLAAALAERGMGLVLDFVPNHMAIGAQNPYWMDVLENGPSSVYAHFFDIDWDPIKEELENRVLVPVLGDQYGAVLERGELKLRFENGSFLLDYYDHQFPVAPRQYTQILKHRLEDLGKTMAGNLHYEDLLSIITALANLPTRAEKDPARIAERNREKEAVKRRLVALCEASPEVRGFIEENVRIFNGTPGDPRSFDLLDGLLREQSYRLAYWRVAAEEINYRRFFDINSLAAIRMEDPRVMQRAHALVFRLVGERKVTGLRIDHPDGLYSPADYFAGLQEELAVTIGRALFEARRAGEPASDEGEPQSWSALEPALRARIREEAQAGRSSPLFRPLYVVIEKILAHDEPIPVRWAVHGSTGYDAMNQLNGILVDRSNARLLDDIFSRFSGLRFDWQELVYQKRRQTMADSLSSELNMLVRRLNRISEYDRRTRDFTMNSLRRALVEVIACFPVYRTYLAPDRRPPEASDARFVLSAVAAAKRKNPALSSSVFDFVRDVLLRRMDDYVPESARQERDEFILKLQQVTAPVMAKSVEDTVFYIFNRLASLNEVGGAPETFGTGVEEFHAANRDRAERWPHSMVSTTTHDTKRSEDVRARIDVLSEVPGEWRKRLAVWSRLNKRHKSRVGELLAPDRNEEILLYQTLLGVFPLEPPGDEELAALRERVQAYMLKALREAKVNTTWVNQDEAWEAAVTRFVELLLDRRRSDRFLRDFLAFQRRVARAGTFNSLSQILLKIAGPGVPDVYQGQELWDPTLVDPDNRRPIDFVKRSRMLDELDARAEEDRVALARELADDDPEGRAKLFLTSQALRLRRRHPELFTEGEYVPLAIVGERAHHAVAFARRRAGVSVVAIAPRLVYGLLERAPDLAGERAWENSWLAIPFAERGTRFVDLFTGRSLPLAEREGRLGLELKEAFAGFPVVLALHVGSEEPALEQPRREAPPSFEPAPI